ncbi:hypothetical protein E3N88_38859 [Mikania micrantha]|uniref:Large ribosomal subunit protein uL11 N-terminal domain-containing protein n=1 Tax=Mikania micrantha TaxID=192012 RepID=A0A5N6LXP9_9ASTR|nr:hypothetical protein E3N88_38859 [Mikania micrantha]
MASVARSCKDVDARSFAARLHHVPGLVEVEVSNMGEVLQELKQTILDQDEANYSYPYFIIIKLALEAGKAPPAPQVGPALGSKGVNIMNICRDYNARTADKAGYIISTEITAPYKDKHRCYFDFQCKTGYLPMKEEVDYRVYFIVMATFSCMFLGSTQG